MLTIMQNNKHILLVKSILVLILMTLDAVSVYAFKKMQRDLEFSNRNYENVESSQNSELSLQEYSQRAYITYKGDRIAPGGRITAKGAHILAIRILEENNFENFKLV